MGSVLGALAFVLLVVFMITFHEFGHYITARWFGIKISKFFVGFGPTLWSVRRGRPETVPGPDGEPVTRPETEYGIKAIPAGGFVKIAGMSPAEEVAPEDVPRSFGAAPAWKRAIVLVAGSATHLITTFIVFSVIYMAVGVAYATPVIDRVEASVGGRPAPAAQAGLRPGQEIVSLGGRPVTGWEDVASSIRSRPGETLTVGVRNPDGSRATVNVTPADVGGRGMIGIVPVAKTRRGPLPAVTQSGAQMWTLATLLVSSAPKAFNPRNLGLVPGKAPTKERPVSIYGAGRVAAGFAASGQFLAFLWFFAQINLFVALFNLAPVPPLDGGLLALLGLEKVFRRPVNYKIVAPITYVAFAILVLIGLSALLQDILHPVVLN